MASARFSDSWEFTRSAPSGRVRTRDGHGFGHVLLGNEIVEELAALAAGFAGLQLGAALGEEEGYVRRLVLGLVV
jgi:hypothetical protein